MPQFFARLALAVALCATAAARAQTVTLGASQDNTLIEDAAGALSNGLGAHLFTGRTFKGPGADIRRALLAFDVAGAVPAGAQVTQAKLTLHLSKTQFGPMPGTLHRVLADWGEGASKATGDEGAGAPAQPGDATWLHTFYPGSFWSKPGGDFAATASALEMMDGVGEYTWTSAQLAADVQAWLDDPGANYGWVLIGDESTGGTSKRFDSRENPNPDYRPRLEISYVPEPATAALLMSGAGAALRRRKRR
jgi:hypothetical protein